VIANAAASFGTATNTHACVGASTIASNSPGAKDYPMQELRSYFCSVQFKHVSLSIGPAH